MSNPYQQCTPHHCTFGELGQMYSSSSFIVGLTVIILVIALIAAIRGGSRWPGVHITRYLILRDLWRKENAGIYGMQLLRSGNVTEIKKEPGEQDLRLSAYLEITGGDMTSKKLNFCDLTPAEVERQYKDLSSKAELLTERAYLTLQDVLDLGSLRFGMNQLLIASLMKRVRDLEETIKDFASAPETE
jgi:hypothetical protein